MLRLSYVPRMTREVVRRRLLADDPLIVLDLGARGGPHNIWEMFAPDVRFVALDADPSVAAEMGSEPVVLGARRESRTLHVAEFGAATSLYRFEELFRDVGNQDALKREAAVPITTVPLDELDIPDVDFIKLDVEGAELEALQGGERVLRSALGVESEVHFPRRPADAPVFSDLDTFLAERGFELYDLDVYRFARTALPSRSLYDNRDEHGAPLTGPTVEGQVLTGDALYFRLDPDRALKLACLFEIHRLSDCAAAILLGSDHEDLLDFLTPAVNGIHPTYQQFLEHARSFGADDRIVGPNYHVLEDLWARTQQAPDARPEQPRIARRILRRFI